MDISERIRLIRKDNKLSQAVFGEKLGTTRDVISNIENGRVEPNGIIINLICNTFNINKEWLQDGSGEKYKILEEDELLGKALANISLSDNKKLKDIVKKLTMLDEKYIDSINILVDGLIKK